MNRDSSVIVAPSVLSADFMQLGQAIQSIQPHVKWLHLDIMDGHFVPNISFGPPIVQAIARQKTGLILDVHLMIESPERYLEAFAEAGADYLTVHWEALKHPHRVLTQIRSLGMKAGIALNPSTSPDVLDYLLDCLDLILVMSVNPGFGGQSFIPSQLIKIKALSERIHADTLIAVDGGVDSSNAAQLKASGANVLIAGSFIFGQPEEKRMDAIHSLINAI